MVDPRILKRGMRNAGQTTLCSLFGLHSYVLCSLFGLHSNAEINEAVSFVSMFTCKRFRSRGHIIGRNRWWLCGNVTPVESMCHRIPSTLVQCRFSATCPPISGSVPIIERRIIIIIIVGIIFKIVVTSVVISDWRILIIFEVLNTTITRFTQGVSDDITKEPM